MAPRGLLQPEYCLVPYGLVLNVLALGLTNPPPPILDLDDPTEFVLDNDPDEPDLEMDDDDPHCCLG